MTRTIIERHQRILGGEHRIQRKPLILGKVTALKGKIVLDVGCGYGGYSLDVARAEARSVVALEIDRGVITEIKTSANHPNLHFVLGAGESLPIRNSSVDVTFLMDVLEHVRCEGPILQEVHRVLKYDGRLFISAPNRFYPLETHGRYQLFPFLPYIPKQLRYLIIDARIYTSKDLIYLLQSKNFEMIYLEYNMPPLDALQGFEEMKKAMRRLFKAIERIPVLRSFGCSINIVCEKCRSGKNMN